MVKILTSGFTNGFTYEFKKQINLYIKSGMTLAFVCSEFDKIYEQNDWYCNYFVKMFKEANINFKNISVIDNRVDKITAQEIVKNADLVWLSGGDTPTQYSYLNDYGLIPIIKEHKGIIIGMSAGSINMAKTAVCTLTCEHDELKIYEALGLVEFSVEPHFNKDNVTDELLTISEKYLLHGICDDGAIICTNEGVIYVGEVYLIDKKNVIKLGECEKIMKLVLPTTEHKEIITDYKKEFESNKDSMDGSAGLSENKSFEEWLQALKDNSKEETVRPGLVPATTFIALDENNRLVGMIDIRHRLNEFLLNFGGHIGYSVRKSERKKGYAKEMLRIALEKCVELNINEVLITCDKNNIASAKTIISNGGILENEVFDPNDNTITQRYRVNL